MVTERLEVRLEPGQREKLERMARTRGVSVAAVVRDLVESGYEDLELAERLAAARRIGALHIEDLPEPEELARQLAETHDSPLP